MTGHPAGTRQARRYLAPGLAGPDLYRWVLIPRAVSQLGYGVNGLITGSTQMSLFAGRGFSIAWCAAVVVISVLVLIGLHRSAKHNDMLLEQRAQIAAFALYFGLVVAVLANTMRGVSPNNLQSIWLAAPILAYILWRVVNIARSEVKSE